MSNFDRLGGFQSLLLNCKMKCKIAYEYSRKFDDQCVVKYQMGPFYKVKIQYSSIEETFLFAFIMLVLVFPLLDIGTSFVRISNF
jgi:hypothetical protein